MITEKLIEVNKNEVNNNMDSEYITIQCSTCGYLMTIHKSRGNACIRCVACGEQTCS